MTPPGDQQGPDHGPDPLAGPEAEAAAAAEAEAGPWGRVPLAPGEAEAEAERHRDRRQSGVVVDPRYEFCAPRFHNFAAAAEGVAAAGEEDPDGGDRWFDELNAGRVATDLRSPGASPRRPAASEPSLDISEVSADGEVVEAEAEDDPDEPVFDWTTHETTPLAKVVAEAAPAEAAEDEVTAEASPAAAEFTPEAAAPRHAMELRSATRPRTAPAAGGWAAGGWAPEHTVAVTPMVLKRSRPARERLAAALTSEELAVEKARAEAALGQALRRRNARACPARPRAVAAAARPIAKPPPARAARPRTAKGFGSSDVRQAAHPMVLRPQTAPGAAWQGRATVPQSPRLHKPARAALASTEERQLAAAAAQAFKARPLRRGVLDGSGRAGVPRVARKPATVPQSPAVSGRRKLKAQQQQQQAALGARKPAAAKKRAGYTGDTTIARPFRLRSQALHKRAQDQFERDARAQADKENRARQFKAGKNRAAETAAFRPQRSGKPLTVPEPVDQNLRSTRQHQRRAAYFEDKEERARVASERAEEERLEREAAEEEELKAYRETLNFKARPLPKFMHGGMF